MQKYCLRSINEVKDWTLLYLKLVKIYSLQIFNIDLSNGNFIGDHLGVQSETSAEYKELCSIVSSFMDLQFTNRIHEREVSMFSFREHFQIEGILLKGIEIFEPKPNSDSSKLKLGIEHIAFIVKDFDSFVKDFPSENVAKLAEYNEGRFLKTKFQNLVEIEFRDKSLIK